VKINANFMVDLHVEKTSNTPRIDFNAIDGVMHMEGRSIPENPSDFYKPLIQWLNEYFNNPKPITVFELRFEYINSGSSKSLLELLRYIKDEHVKGKECIIKWHYEEDDESVQELGEHYQYTLKIPFEFYSY
jgi:hypothetical protein